MSNQEATNESELADLESEGMYILERRQLFSRSLLWKLQHNYFAERGIDAWRSGEVPHYVTSNPTIANSYAEIAFAYMRDQLRLGLDQDEPLYICELGAGSGRFAFHFLNRLVRLCEQSELAHGSFLYVMTDVTESNLVFWRQHPYLQSYLENGLLDVALFDAGHADELRLEYSGRTVRSGSLSRPMMVIANYVFDSIPQELYYIEQQRVYRCLTSLLVGEKPDRLDDTALLARLTVQYEYEEQQEEAYPREQHLSLLLDGYRQTIHRSHLLFPETGLRCVQRLRTLSRQGLLLLSSDKGDHRTSALQDSPPPAFIRHGSFSLNVNYHAFIAYCEQAGGISLCPTKRYSNVNVIALMLFDGAHHYLDTMLAYRRYVQEFGPDDFFSVTKHARLHIDDMTLEHILAYLRLGLYDSHQFARYLPRLLQICSDFDDEEQCEVIEAIDQVWAIYFPLGEEVDLAYQIAHLLYEMSEYKRALLYFERSVRLYGEHSGTLYNMASCYRMLGQYTRAIPLLKKVVKHDADNAAANDLLQLCMKR